MGEISESHRLDIADFIDWKAVGPRLDEITTDDITDIDKEGCDELDKRRKLVHKWWQKNGHWATYHAMIAAMLKVGRSADAGKVCKLLIGEKKIYTTTENNSDTIIVSPHYIHVFFSVTAAVTDGPSQATAIPDHTTHDGKAHNNILSKWLCMLHRAVLM